MAKIGAAFSMAEAKIFLTRDPREQLVAPLGHLPLPKGWNDDQLVEITLADKWHWQLLRHFPVGELLSHGILPPLDEAYLGVFLTAARDLPNLPAERVEMFRQEYCGSDPSGLLGLLMVLTDPTYRDGLLLVKALSSVASTEYFRRYFGSFMTPDFLDRFCSDTADSFSWKRLASPKLVLVDFGTVTRGNEQSNLVASALHRRHLERLAGLSAAQLRRYQGYHRASWVARGIG